MNSGVAARRLINWQVQFDQKLNRELSAAKDRRTCFEITSRFASMSFNREPQESGHGRVWLPIARLTALVPAEAEDLLVLRFSWVA